MREGYELRNRGKKRKLGLSSKQVRLEKKVWEFRFYPHLTADRSQGNLMYILAEISPPG